MRVRLGLGVNWEEDIDMSRESRLQPLKFKGLWPRLRSSQRLRNPLVLPGITEERSYSLSMTRTILVLSGRWGWCLGDCQDVIHALNDARWARAFYSFK